MNDELTFEYSKEGFESRLRSIEDTFNDSIFTKDEYDHFRESELKEFCLVKDIQIFCFG